MKAKNELALDALRTAKSRLEVMQPNYEALKEKHELVKAERDALRALVVEKDRALSAFIDAVRASEELHRECGDEPAYLVSATVTRPDFEKHEQALALKEAELEAEA